MKMPSRVAMKRVTNGITMKLVVGLTSVKIIVTIGALKKRSIRRRPRGTMNNHGSRRVSMMHGADRTLFLGLKNRGTRLTDSGKGIH